MPPYRSKLRSFAAQRRKRPLRPERYFQLVWEGYRRISRGGEHRSLHDWKALTIRILFLYLLAGILLTLVSIDADDGQDLVSVVKVSLRVNDTLAQQIEAAIGPFRVVTP
jgi:hypothetical protein